MKNSISDIDDSPKWFPFYTRSRFEKKCMENLTKSGFEAYLPLKRTLRNWSDRKKTVDIPLFSSYIFVRIAEKNIFEVLNITGIVRYIIFNNRPAIVRDFEIDIIKKLLSDKTELEVVDGILKEGVEITIQSGVLKGYQGKIASIKGNNRLIVEIESINKTMIVTLDNTNINIIK